MRALSALLLTLTLAATAAAELPDWVDVPAVRHAWTSDATTWYDDESLPQVAQRVKPDGTTHLVDPFRNPGRPGEDKTGTPNAENPWRFTGGIDDCHDVVDVVRFYWRPEGKPVRLYQADGTTGPPTNMAYKVWRGVYPRGAVLGEVLKTDGRIFEVRARIKDEDGSSTWHTHRFEDGAKPTGYDAAAVTDCQACHEDIGKHALRLDPRRKWYIFTRGMERGGAFHQHFFEWRKVHAQPGLFHPVEFNADLAELYEVLTLRNGEWVTQ